MLDYEFFEYIPYARGSIYAEEHKLLHKFTTLESKAVKLSYASKRKAYLARQALLGYIQNNKMPFEASTCGSDFIIYKK